MGRLENQIGNSGSDKFISNRMTDANDLGKDTSIFANI